MTVGQFTYQEIESQPEIWDLTLNKICDHIGELKSEISKNPKTPYVVLGCGSTHYLAMHTASILRLNGIYAIHAPSSDLVYYPLNQYPEGFQLLPISRSGTTSETIWAINRYKQTYSKGKITSITCVEDTPMALASDVKLVAADAMEKSVAQTRSFTSMMLLSQILAGLLSGNEQIIMNQKRLPEVLRKLSALYKPLIEKMGRDLSIERIFFLGDGPLYGIACEAMLKAKEMSCSWVEAYHTLEFRHGPMALVTDKTLVIGLISDSAGEAECRVLRDMKKLGARTLALVEDRSKIEQIGIDDLIELNSGLNEVERTTVYLPLLQWLAFYRSLEKGLDPDNPVNLSQVVYLE
jgi:glutamine---fructose-6-phosphate transaminase (isomerizing)